MSTIDKKDHVRTAPTNEVEQQYAGESQRDDAEPVQPEVATQRMAPGQSAGVPDGFFWSAQANGKPVIKPTNAHINELAAQLADVYEDDERHEQLKVTPALAKSLSTAIVQAKRKTKFKTIMDVAQQIDNEEDTLFDKQLDKAVALLEKLDAGWLANSIIRAVGMCAQQEAANNLSWAMLHNERYYQLTEAGNEQGAENALINFESSRTQMLVAMAVLDWARSTETFTPDYARAARDALSLRGWSMTQNMTQQRTAVRQNTKEQLFGKAPATPDEAYNAA